MCRDAAHRSTVLFNATYQIYINEFAEATRHNRQCGVALSDRIGCELFKTANDEMDSRSSLNDLNTALGLAE